MFPCSPNLAKSSPYTPFIPVELEIDSPSFWISSIDDSLPDVDTTVISSLPVSVTRNHNILR